MTLIKFSKFNLCSTYPWKDLKDHIYFLLDYIDYIKNKSYVLQQPAAAAAILIYHGNAVVYRNYHG